MEFVTSPWFGLMTFMMGVLVSIFSPDLRGWLLEVVSRPSRALTSRRLKAMERRVDLLKRMQSSPILIQGFFASYLFIALILLCHKISLLLPRPQQGHCPRRSSSA